MSSQGFWYIGAISIDHSWIQGRKMLMAFQGCSAHICRGESLTVTFLNIRSFQEWRKVAGLRNPAQFQKQHRKMFSVCKKTLYCSKPLHNLIFSLACFETIWNSKHSKMFSVFTMQKDLYCFKNCIFRRNQQKKRTKLVSSGEP